jgi:hypothetical protein
MTTAAGGRSRRQSAFSPASRLAPLDRRAPDPHQSGFRTTKVRVPAAPAASGSPASPSQCNGVRWASSQHTTQTPAAAAATSSSRNGWRRRNLIVSRGGLVSCRWYAPLAMPALHRTSGPARSLQATTASLVWSDPRCSNASRSAAVPASTRLQARHARATTTSPCIPGARVVPSRDVRQSQVSRPPAGSFLAAYGKVLMAADTRCRGWAGRGRGTGRAGRRAV